jgi:hypothetical protein
MAGSTYVDINTTTGELERKTAINASTGATDADKIARLNASGEWDVSMIPSTAGTSAETIQASEDLAAGDFVNVHETGGARRVQKALATDTTKPAHGYVTATVSSGANATVYLTGINANVALTGFTTSDVGKPVFLSAGTSGGVTKTPPTSTGNLLQRLGYIVEVAGTVRVQLDMSYAVKM